jgi:hypothetical protein
MLRGGPGPSTNGAGTARRQRELKQCESESESEGESERREQLRRRVQKEGKTRRDNSLEKNVVMVLSKALAGTGERKEVGGTEAWGQGGRCFRSLWLSGSGTGQPVRSCRPAACGARAAWQWVTIDKAAS